MANSMPHSLHMAKNQRVGVIAQTLDLQSEGCAFVNVMTLGKVFTHKCAYCQPVLSSNEVDLLRYST